MKELADCTTTQFCVTANAPGVGMLMNFPCSDFMVSSSFVETRNGMIAEPGGPVIHPDLTLMVVPSGVLMSIGVLQSLSVTGR